MQMSKSTASTNDLPADVVGYKPQILKIKLSPFNSWIEKRLIELLDGLEDDIVCSFVFNYLEDAQKRAKKEGPLANPSGGLNAPEIYSSLIGFLGAKKSQIFVCELFGLLREAEASENGVPLEFALKPEEAEKEAFGIINDKRKEMEFSDRVRREVRSNNHYNRREFDRKYNNRHGEDRRYDNRHDDRDDRHSRRRHSRSHSRSRSRSNSRSRSFRSSRRYYEDRQGESRYESKYRQRDSHGHRESTDRFRDSNDRSRDSHYRHRDSNYKYGDSRTHDRANKSPIPSSSPESPSPCWESTTKPAQLFNAAAPNVQETVPTELELALKARALKSLVEKKKD